MTKTSDRGRADEARERKNEERREAMANELKRESERTNGEPVGEEREEKRECASERDGGKNEGEGRDHTARRETRIRTVNRFSKILGFALFSLIDYRFYCEIYIYILRI